MPGYGTPLSLTLPTINGIATEAQAAPLINTALSAIIARLESKVGAADLDINADVSFKSGSVYSGITNLQRAAFRNLTASLTAASNPSTVYVLNGDLHYIDAAGNLVQITSGGQVNVSTTGGITGAGYGTGSVEVNYDSVNGQYRMRDGAATDAFADVALADLLLNDGSGNFIRLQAPAMSADYTLTLPSAAPAGTSLLQMTAAGLVQATLTPSVTTLTAGDVIVPNQESYKHSFGKIGLHASAMHCDELGTAAADWQTNSAGSWVIVDAGAILFCPVPLHTGTTLTSVSYFLTLTTTANRTVRLRRLDPTTLAVTTAATVTQSIGAVNNGRVAFNLADTVIDEDFLYYLEYVGDAGLASDTVHGAQLTYSVL